MAEPPWKPDVVVSPDLATALIEEQFPALAPVRLVPLGEGWDNTAFRVADLVFRFPRRRIAVPLIETEIRLLPRLAPRLSVPIPHPAFIGRPTDAYPWPFAGYPLLPGRTACRLAFTGAQRAALARPLGRFLAELHAFPAAEARTLGAGGDAFGKLEVPRLVSQLHERLDCLASELPADRAAAARRFADTVAAALPAGHAARADTLVHGDLYVRHLLVEEAGGAGGLSGVIDWGDIHVGDPAVDLSVAWGFLPPAAHGSFCRAYGAIDETTWLLARFRALCMGAALIHYGTESGDGDLAREGRTSLDHVLDHVRG